MKIKLDFELLNSVYVYTQDNRAELDALMSFKEHPSACFIIEKQLAEKLKMHFTYPCNCIHLTTKTDLLQVGITAHIAKILASKNIPCNTVSAFNHDYFFVPEDRAKDALTLLRNALS